MNPPEKRPVTDALKNFLIEATGKPVAVTKAPTKDEDELVVADPPYAIIYPILGGGFWGPEYATPEDSADFSYQVTSVGLRDDQCQWMADRVREAVVGRDRFGKFLYDFTVYGIKVADRVIEGGAAGPTLNGRIYTVPDTYLIRVVPE